MKSKVVIVFEAAIFSTTLAPSVMDVGCAQYLGNVGSQGETGQNTLEEALEIQARRIAAAEANPDAGSGTPYLDAGGVIGAAVIAGAVFGGIAAAFPIRGRTDKYAVMSAVKLNHSQKKLLSQGLGGIT